MDGVAVMRPDLDQDYYGALLRGEKTRLEEVERDLIDSAQDSVEALEGYSESDDVPADSAAMISERERAQQMSHNLRNVLTQIDFALDRIEDGTFGICEMCGVEVPEERLSRMPWVANCVECQNLIDEGMA